MAVAPSPAASEIARAERPSAATSLRSASRSTGPMSRGIIPPGHKIAQGDVSPIDDGGYVPVSSALMSIADFISRCDRYCADTGRKRSWLSKKLFDDTFRLDQLAGGGSDVGVRRLERALAELAALEAANDTSEQDAAA